MDNILDKIIAAKSNRLEERKKMFSAQALEAKSRALPAPRLDFRAALERPPGPGDGPGPVLPRIIAEVKKASPSRGVLRADFRPLDIARAYARGGAAALSVLTEEDHFLGSDGYLQEISREVALPTLRKDFIIDAYQVHEAKCLGASAYLLIVACLQQPELAALVALGAELGLTPLVEAHTGDEARRALDAGATLIGINNRDLKTFHTSLETTYQIRPLIPPGITVVSESGIFTRADLEKLADADVQAALIGESLIREDDIEGKLRELLAA